MDMFELNNLINVAIQPACPHTHTETVESPLGGYTVWCNDCDTNVTEVENDIEEFDLAVEQLLLEESEAE